MNVVPLPIIDVSVDELLKRGTLFRYSSEDAYTNRLESCISDKMNMYSLCVNSGGSALFLCLYYYIKQTGNKKVLVNSFTLSPVIGSIRHAGGDPILVDTDIENLSMDMNDLRAKHKQTGADIILVSYMRGHVPNIESLVGYANSNNMILIEDCAHTFGAKCNGKYIGTFGNAGCTSFQTNKLINGGEGGCIFSNDRQLVASCVILSGSYANYDRHGIYDTIKATQWNELFNTLPNFSLRMNEMTACIVLQSMHQIERLLMTYQRNFMYIMHNLSDNSDKCRLYTSNAICPLSFQFRLLVNDNRCEMFSSYLKTREISHQWYGCKESKGFTSTYRNWGFGEVKLTHTDDILRNLFDIPLTHTRDWDKERMDVFLNRIKDAINLI